MADNIITTQIKVDAGAAIQTVGDLRKQLDGLKQASGEAGEAAGKSFGDNWSNNLGAAGASVQKLQEQLTGLGLGAGNLQALAQVGQTLSGGMAAAAQNAALFTTAGAGATASLHSLNTAMQLKSGLTGMQAVGSQFKQWDVFIHALQLSLKGLGGALGSVATGIVNTNKAGAQWAQSDKQRVQANADDWQNLNSQKLSDSRKLSSSLMNLSDMVFSMELERAGSNQKARAEIMKKQFEINKAFQTADATINYLKGLVAIPASTPEPMATFEQVALTATYVASIAKIAAARFDGGTASALSAGGANAGAGVNITSVNSTLLRGQQQQTAATAQPTRNLKVYVTESDISSVQNKVNAIKAGATFK